MAEASTLSSGDQADRTLMRAGRNDP
jgi:hypothetical protein